MKTFIPTQKTNSKRKISPLRIILISLFVLTGIVTCFIEFSQNSMTWDDIYTYLGIYPRVENDDCLHVHFINVGQGDCTLIKTNDSAVLIDAGEKGNEKLVTDYIKSQGIDTLDFVIATHPHSDHIGSLDEVIDSFTVKNVLMPKLSEFNTPTTSAYESFLKSVKASGARVISAKPGDVHSLGRIEMTVLSPFEQSDDLNDMSVVVNLSFGDTSFLFTGDAEKAAENLILDSDYSQYLKSDVLKVGHHGSSSSTGSNFLEAVSPQYAVISCAKGNDYGHPHKETISLLYDYGIEILRTDDLGTVIIESDGKNITDISGEFNDKNYR